MVVSACKNNSSTDLEFLYPNEIVVNNLQAKYDSAKLLIYEAQLGIWRYGYPMQELYEKKPMSKTSFTSCELKFIKLDIDSEKNLVEMHFVMIKDSATIVVSNGKPMPSSVIFLNGIPNRIRKGEGGHNEIGYDINENSRSNFKKELKLHYHNLNPWLKQEAQKRGYI